MDKRESPYEHFLKVTFLWILLIVSCIGVLVVGVGSAFLPIICVGAFHSAWYLLLYIATPFCIAGAMAFFDVFCEGLAEKIGCMTRGYKR